jgi:hypothetical protein
MGNYNMLGGESETSALNFSIATTLLAFSHAPQQRRQSTSFGFTALIGLQFLENDGSRPTARLVTTLWHRSGAVTRGGEGE